MRDGNLWMLQVDLMSLRRRLRDKYEVDVHMFYARTSSEETQGKLGITSYVRISHQIYNTKEEFIKLRDAINDISFQNQSRS